MIGRFSRASTQTYRAMRAWAETPGAAWLLGGWSVAEAMVWFILPDFLLAPLVLLAPEKRWRLFWMSLLGSAVGILLMAGLCLLAPDWIATWLFRLPYTHPDMLPKLTRLSEAVGLPGILLQPISGVPVKVWTYATLQQHLWPFPAFFTLVLLGRALRMAAFTLLAGWVAQHRRTVLMNGWLLWLGLYLLLFFPLLKLTSAP